MSDRTWRRWRAKYSIVKVFVDYADGKHLLRYASQLYTERFGVRLGGFLGSLRENLCMAVIYGFTDSLAIRSWAPGHDASQDEVLSRMETQIANATFRDGEGYVLVWPDPRTGVMTPLQLPASECVAEDDEFNPSRVSRLTRYRMDDEGVLWRTTYSDDGVTVARCDDHRVPGGIPLDTALPELKEPRFQRVSSTPLPPGLTECPVCRFKLDAVIQTDHGRSILTDVIPLQDSLNKVLNDIMVVSERHAVPLIFLLKYVAKVGAQLAASNPYALDDAKPEFPCDPEEANAEEQKRQVDALGAGVKKFYPEWAKRNGQGKFDPEKQEIFVTDAEGPMGQITPPSMEWQIKVANELALAISRVVGLPAYYFTGDLGDVPSGDAFRWLSARKIARLQKFQKDNTPEYARLAGMLGVENPKIEWEPVIPQSMMEQLNIAMAMQSVHLPLVEIYKWLGLENPERLAQDAQREIALKGGSGQEYQDMSNLVGIQRNLQNSTIGG